MSAPTIIDIKTVVAIKGFDVSSVLFKNNGGVVTEISITPELPLGLTLSMEHKACALRGIAMQLSPRTVYTITVGNADGKNISTIEIAVVEAAIKRQREDIIHVHEGRHDLDTPRSQIENALQDGVTMQSHIKPHEKFAHQPTGDDKRLSQQTHNNPEAERRAQNTPELTPSPSAKLQAVLAAKPPAPSPMPG